MPSRRLQTNSQGVKIAELETCWPAVTLLFPIWGRDIMKNESYSVSAVGRCKFDLFFCKLFNFQKLFRDTTESLWLCAMPSLLSNLRFNLWRFDILTFSPAVRSMTRRQVCQEKKKTVTSSLFGLLSKIKRGNVSKCQHFSSCQIKNCENYLTAGLIGLLIISTEASEGLKFTL